MSYDPERTHEGEIGEFEGFDEEPLSVSSSSASYRHGDPVAILESDSGGFLSSPVQDRLINVIHAQVASLRTNETLAFFRIITGKTSQAKNDNNDVTTLCLSFTQFFWGSFPIPQNQNAGHPPTAPTRVTRLPLRCNRFTRRVVCYPTVVRRNAFPHFGDDDPSVTNYEPEAPAATLDPPLWKHEARFTEFLWKTTTNK